MVIWWCFFLNQTCRHARQIQVISTNAKNEISAVVLMEHHVKDLYLIATDHYQHFVRMVAAKKGKYYLKMEK